MKSAPLPRAILSFSGFPFSDPFDFDREVRYAGCMPEGSHAFQVGSICCTVLTDGYDSYPTEWFFPNADPRSVQATLEGRGMPGRSVLSPYTCLLIETGRQVILVDTGAGSAGRTSGAICARLEMAGIRPRNVDTVVLTHAHPDHIGGAVGRGGRPVFANARHVLSEFEFAFWTSRRPDLSHMRVPHELRTAMAPTARTVFDALRIQIETVDRETEIAPGVRLIPAPGHTPGHLALLVTSEGSHLLNLGDAAVHPLHLEQPELENGFDQAAAIAADTRRELLGRAVSEGMRLMAFHFPFPSVGRVAAREEGGWSWSPGW